MRELDLLLNELAQGLRPTAWGVDWFTGLPEERQREALDALALWCWQAHPTEAEAAEAIAGSELRPTHTPAVLLARGCSQHHIGTVARLRPRDERVKAFRLLVRLLAVADARRRAQCRAWFGDAPCHHEWHRLGPEPPAENGQG
jgi:hypothetical protein